MGKSEVIRSRSRILGNLRASRGRVGRSTGPPGKKLSAPIGKRPLARRLHTSRTIGKEMPNGFEASERLEGRIIFAWPIALCARASPARNAEFGSSSDRKTKLGSTKKRAWRSVLQLSVASSLNSNPVRLAFSKFRYHFSSAVTSIVRNCKRAEDSCVFLAGYVDCVPHLIRPISRQNALRMAPGETPRS
jgi:hypothetical protein